MKDVESDIKSALSLPTLHEAARTLSYAMVNPLRNLTENEGRRHTLIVGPTGSGKSSLAKALRRVSPTAIIDSTQLVSRGYEGTPLSTTVRALLKECANNEDAAQYGTVVLDNLDCLLGSSVPPQRRCLWNELLAYLEGCFLNLGGERTVATHSILFVGLLRLPEYPQGTNRNAYLLDSGVPPAILGRMPSQIFLPSPDENALFAVLQKSRAQLFKQYRITRTAREYLAEKAARRCLGAWGLRHVLSELELALGLEDSQPKRIDRPFLERRFGKL